MRRLSYRMLAVAALASAGGCTLTVTNPNAPDAERAFADPDGLAALLSGAFRTWLETRANYFVMPLTRMADNYTASWNNAAIRFYGSIGAECPQRCGWTNSATAPEAAGGPTVEASWYGFYTVLSAATDVLRGIENGICFDEICESDNTLTSRNKAIGKMLQGMALAGIAMIYDQGFVVDETTDLSDPLGLPFSTREEVRDAALAKFEEAYTEAGLKTWSTENDWSGVGAGRSYTNTQIRQLIRTMQAELLAMYPRNGAENGQVNWGQVANFASQGISSGATFNYEYYVDVTGRECGIDCVKTWGNSIGTMRVHTRVAAAITTNHVNPWPEAQGGNPCPTVPRNGERRVGDGSYGPEDDFNGYATLAATPNAGTDFACSEVPIFPAARGQYHQSNLQHVRYQHLAYRGENLPGFDATGQDPMYTTQMNDLLWAEGLIRSGGSMATAAAKINNSRVTRGGLTPLSSSATQAEALAALQYEQELEFMGQGTDVFYNRRRVDALVTGTPRHMPVPAKEMDVLVREIYTFGGPNEPDMAPGVDGKRIRSARDIWNDYRAMVPKRWGIW